MCVNLKCAQQRKGLNTYGSVKFDTQETERLLSACESFEKDAAKRFPDRPCLTTVVDMNGKTVFVTRFVRALRPPQELLDAFPNNPQEATVSSANTNNILLSFHDRLLNMSSCMRKKIRSL